MAASTQNQALSALLFLYAHVLEIELPQISGMTPARRPQRLPAVFTKEEAHRVIAHLKGDYALMARMLYGSGLRSWSALRLEGEGPRLCPVADHRARGAKATRTG